MRAIWKMTARAGQRTSARWALVSIWQRVPAVRWGILTVALVVYAIASLEPFDLQMPKQVPNHAERTTDGWRFASPGIVLVEPPHDWLGAARMTETLGLSLIIRPYLAVQSGPARILTISRDSHFRNLMVAQDGGDLVLRLRTQESDLNGLVAGEPFARVPDVFASTQWVKINLRIAPRALAIDVDGRSEFVAELPPAVLETWNPGFSIVLGNETTCDRPWLGEIRAAAIEVSGQEHDYAAANNIQLPASCWVMGYRPVLVPFRLFLLDDAIRNTLMYIPLGLMFGLMLRSGGPVSFFQGLLLVVGVSMTFEIAQLFVASRFPSIDDVLFNTIGGGVGLVLALVLTRRARA